MLRGSSEMASCFYYIENLIQKEYRVVRSAPRVVSRKVNNQLSFSLYLYKLLTGTSPEDFESWGRLTLINPANIG